MPSNFQKFFARVPASVWIVLLVLVAWIFYAGISTGMLPRILGPSKSV